MNNYEKTGLLQVFINVIFWDIKSSLVSAVTMKELISNIANHNLCVLSSCNLI